MFLEFRIEDIKTSFISVSYLRYTNVMTLKLCTLTKLHCYPFDIKTFCFSRNFRSVYKPSPSPPRQGVLKYKCCFLVNDFICFAWFETLDSPVLKITNLFFSVCFIFSLHWHCKMGEKSTMKQHFIIKNFFLERNV